MWLAFSLRWSSHQVSKVVFFALPVKQLSQVVIDKVNCPRVDCSCWSSHQRAALLVVSDRYLASIKYFFAKLGLAFLVYSVLCKAIIKVVSCSVHSVGPITILHLILFAKIRTLALLHWLNHSEVIKLATSCQTIQLKLAKFLLASNELQHAVEVIMAREVIQTLLCVPHAFNHMQTALLVVVSLHQCAYHVEPTRSPLHLFTSQLSPQSHHFLLEVPEVTPIELNELLEFVGLEIKC